MRSFCVRLSYVLGVGMGVLAATTLAHGQQTTSNYARATKPPAKKPTVEPSAPGAVHRIELYSGTRRSVRYLPTGNVSNADRATARELQRAENEQSYLFDLERVKQQYVSDERLLQQDRREVQKQLYGRSITREQDASRFGEQNYLNGYGSGLYGGYGGYGMYGGLGYGGYGSRMGMAGAMGHSRVTETRSLQNGVGDEGRIKDAMAKAIANQTSPEYAEQAMRNYEKTLARAASSPVLAKTLSLRKAPIATADAEVSYPENSKVTIWIGNDRYDGVVTADRPTWIVLKTGDGEMRVRKSSIERSIVRSKPDQPPSRTSASK